MYRTPAGTSLWKLISSAQTHVTSQPLATSCSAWGRTKACKVTGNVVTKQIFFNTSAFHAFLSVEINGAVLSSVSIRFHYENDQTMSGPEYSHYGHSIKHCIY